MAYITLANTNKIIFKNYIKELNLDGEIYHIPIYFFSKYEKNALLAIQELLKDPEKYFNEIYQPYEAVDTYSYVYEEQQPAYHKFSCCPRLQSDYQNFEIPSEIKEKGPELVKEFREWFEEVKHLLDRPDVFVARLQARWGIITNPKAINRDNSGSTIIDNLNIEELEEQIDRLIKEAGHFYNKSEKNKEILKRFQTLTFIAFRDDDIYNNDSGYSDEEVKQLLRHYDEEYKRPLKKYLIEYYRLKLNPEIKMEGFLLERLGFNPCGHCHDDAYEPNQKSEEQKFTLDFMLENSNFFLTMFSLYYPFSEKQLIKFKDTLIFGSNEESHEDGSIPATMYATYGLNFNTKIKWTNEVREAYWVEPYLIHAFGSEDVWYKRDFANLPLSNESELDFFRNYRKNWAFAYSEDQEETEMCIEIDEIFTKELGKAIDRSNFQDWSSYIKSFYEENEFEIIKFIFNENFYKQMFEKVKYDNPKFELEEYIKKINTAHTELMTIESKFALLSKINILKGYFSLADEGKEYSGLINEILSEQVEEFTLIKNMILENKNDSILNLLNDLMTKITNELFKNPCNKKWLDLIDTGDSDIKYCSDCKKNVFYVSTQNEFLVRKNLEQCVAFGPFGFKPTEGDNDNFKSCRIVSDLEPLLGQPIVLKQQFY